MGDPQEVYLNQIVDAVLTYDYIKMVEKTREALAAGLEPAAIIEKGLATGLRIVGEKFAEGELFLTDLVSAAEPVQRIVKELIEPEIARRKEVRKSLGKVVLGTVAGDIHDIGKNIVGAILFSGGFEVYDVGKDAPAKEFIRKMKETNANVVGASALLSTTLPAQRELIQALVAEGMRHRVKAIVGGGPVTEEWAREIGADGYGIDAVEALRLAKSLLGIR